MIDKSQQVLLEQLMKFLSSLRQKQTPYLQKQTDLRRRALRLLDWYNGFQINHLNGALDAQFAKPRNMKLQLATLNITEYIVDQVANYLKNGLTITAESESDQAILDEIINDNHADILFQQLAHYIFLLKTCFVKCAWRNDKVMLDLMGPQYTSIDSDENDPSVMKRIIYPKSIVRFDNYRPVGTYAYWDEETFKLLNENGREVPNPDNPSNVNPYGIIPIACFRETDPTEGYYVWPPDDLDNAQTNVNVLRTYMMYLIKLQSFSQPVIHNPGSKDAVITVDPSLPIILYDKPDLKSLFEFVTPTPAIDSVKDVMETLLSEVFAVYGVDPGSFVQSKAVRSAESIQASNAKLEEYRDNMKLMFINQMHDLLDIIRVVWNTHNSNKLSDGEFVVRIIESKIQPDKVDDRLKLRDWELEHNLTTLPEVMIEEEGDLTLEEAEERIITNFETNNRLKGETQGSMPDPLSSAGTDVSGSQASSSYNGIPQTKTAQQMPLSTGEIPEEQFKQAGAPQK